MKTIVKILFVVAVLWSLAFIFKLGNSFAANNNACSSDNCPGIFILLSGQTARQLQKKTQNLNLKIQHQWLQKLKE